jgi:hypothetical protein
MRPYLKITNMTDEFDPAPELLPALPSLFPLPDDVRQWGPEVVAHIQTLMYGLVAGGKSEPARVAAAKMLLERLAPREDLDQKRREAEERQDAIAEAKGLMAEFAASKHAGLYQPPALDQESAPRAADAAGDAG